MSASLRSWRLLSVPYCKSDQVLLCPSDTAKASLDTAKGLFPHSYGQNGNSGMHTYLTGIVSKSMAALVVPAETILYADMWFYPTGALGGNYGYIRFYPGDSGWTSDAWRVVGRHNNGAVCAFYDGHAKVLDYSKITGTTGPGDTACLFDNQ